MMNNSQPQKTINLLKQDSFQFLAWRKIADCYGILCDENKLRAISSLSEEDVLDTLLSSTGMFFTEDEKQRVIEERQNYYYDYIGTY